MSKVIGSVRKSALVLVRMYAGNGREMCLKEGGTYGPL